MLMILGLSLFPTGCASVGCAGEDPGVDDSAADQFAGAQPEALPPLVPGTPTVFGTWKGDTTNMDAFETLVLMTDGRYHGARNVMCVKAPCPPIGEDGTYKLYTRETKRFVEVVKEGAETPDRFEYAFAVDTLRLRPLHPGSEWRSMQRAEVAWCDAARDCAAQNLLIGPCAGSFACTRAQCSWKCGSSGETSVLPAGEDPPAERAPVENPRPSLAAP
jgi:hypothetical protein